MTLPNPYVTQLPRHGCPESSRPLFIISIAEPWIGLSAYRLWMNARSSTFVARCGKRSDTIFPVWPRGLNFHSGPARLPFSPWKVTSFSVPGSGWPARLTSSGL